MVRVVSGWGEPLPAHSRSSNHASAAPVSTGRLAV
jgi:hypothetical protein